MVLFYIDLHSEELKAVGRAFAHLPLVLSGATCKHDDVNTTHGGGILADIFLDAVGVHLFGETRVVVALLNAFENVAEVAGAAAHTGQTRFLVQKV